MRKTALITGASSGIGLELAKIHASKGGDLILIARSKEKLQTLKTELESTYSCSVYILVKDLSILNSAQEVFNEVQSRHLKVDYLINNAGFGDFGQFKDTSWEKEQQMINLNITALTQLTKLFLPQMISRSSGKIMNLASTAAFLPGPYMAVYFATKAYVLSFSEAIKNELIGTGVSVTALCPGPTKSGFQDVGTIENSGLFRGKKLPTSKVVAIYGYNEMLRDKSVAIHGLKNYILVNSGRFAPRSLVVKLVSKLQK